MIGRRAGPWAVVALVLLSGAPAAFAGDEGAVTARVAVHPLTIALELADTNVQVGKAFQARAVISNEGRTTVRGVVVTLRVDPAGLIVRKGADSTVGQLRAGRSTTLTWSLCAASAGAYVVLAQATLDGATIESLARIVTATGGRRGC